MSHTHCPRPPAPLEPAGGPPSILWGLLDPPQTPAALWGAQSTLHMQLEGYGSSSSPLWLPIILEEKAKAVAVVWDAVTMIINDDGEHRCQRPRCGLGSGAVQALFTAGQQGELGQASTSLSLAGNGAMTVLRGRGSVPSPLRPQQTV
ncbi:hypothetical protein J1605_012908 [Eschrichtius robustus]|uniref:Uncharacterized protein n=1 Tax=Eschrichtius robustus TaxID=9764 RepID=A0AB34GFP8_ESCRO|nr:hypothetical protein J1605_012908 [Eschrichtius robustus]